MKLVFYSSTITMMHGPINIRIFVPSAGFNPTIAALERPQTYALDRTTTRNSTEIIY